MNYRRHSKSFLAVSLLLLSAALLSMGLLTVMAQDDEADPLGEPGTFLTSYYDAWVSSPHARFEDDAFRHWDEDGEISERCATCHSTPGYIDFLGADGSEFGVVDMPAELGTVVNCNACHNSVSSQLTSVVFPSGAEVTGIADDARCMVCHQGRSSGLSVASDIEAVGLTDSPHTVSEELGFINIHYYAAAASLYGSDVSGGFEFADMPYYGQNLHVEGYSSCSDCHNPHSLELDVAECATCHADVETVEDLRGIRSLASNVDFDGDGDMAEGIAFEIETLQATLFTSIQLYASEVVGTPIAYADGYPYFFTDTDGDGVASEEEASRDNSYASFTPALLEAAYNYQVSQKDPGGYAHNPDYHIQLLFDSITALNEELGEDGADLSGASRSASGHFAFGDDAFRHWDEDGEVSARCSKCHSAEGLPFFLEHGTTIAFEPANSLQCSTCHDTSTPEFALYPVTEVAFPSGAVVSYGEDAVSNTCLNCHQGRESTVSLNNAIMAVNVADDEVAEGLNFRNPHYYSAGASWFGTEVQGAYEYDGMEYNSAYEHTRQFNECTECHGAHTVEFEFAECTECHENVETAADVRLIRAHPDDAERFDYDGDGDDSEPIRDELAAFEDILRVLIFEYASETVGTPIAYEPSSYPYFFLDTNGNGEADPDEANFGNRYNQWTPDLLRAAYNYTYIAKDPGVYAIMPTTACKCCTTASSLSAAKRPLKACCVRWWTTTSSHSTLIVTLRRTAVG
ncbi:MAG: hypothetical protein AAF125_10850 [Chloroflexota bacterium]